jgi:8-oxo-dGTP diphosphatase
MAGCADALEQPRPTVAPGLPVILVAAVCLVDQGGRILLASRPAGKSMAGLWEFPGGKVEAGESPEFALCRELEEELGIQVRECCLSPLGFASHAYTERNMHLLMPLYVCRMWKGTPQPKEGQELAWVKPDALASYEMPPADIPLIYQIIDRL